MTGVQTCALPIYTLVEDEEYAKANKLGLWQTEFEFPWDFRKSQKK